MVRKEFTFQFEDDEYEKLQEWYKTVTNEETYFGAIGGELTFLITPTSIGEIVEVEYDGERFLLRDIT